MNAELLKNESVAYALAAGLIDLGSSRDLDREIERSQRRARLLRKVAK